MQSREEYMLPPISWYSQRGDKGSSSSTREWIIHVVVCHAGSNFSLLKSLTSPCVHFSVFHFAPHYICLSFARLGETALEHAMHAPPPPGCAGRPLHTCLNTIVWFYLISTNHLWCKHSKLKTLSKYAWKEISMEIGWNLLHSLIP
jgi:hypothetical protein